MNPTPAARADDAGDHGGVAIDDEQDVPLDTGRLVGIAGRVLGVLGIPAEGRLEITLTDVARIAELKHEALGVRAPTDVLSFPLDSPEDPMPGPLMLGDVVICPAVAERQARALGRRLDEEMAQLLVHGVLHLLGRDHQDLRAEHEMAREERRLLAAVGEAAG